jgi:Domain of unknown function (DUF4407)
VGRLLIFLSGAQSDILDSVQTDRAKYQGVGFAILFTGVLACVSMCFALHTALSASLAWAVVAGLGWAFLIMGIDRMLVVSMLARHGFRNFLLVILPRLLLGLLLSIIISTPIVLEIFKPEIDQEITAIHQQQVSAAAQTAQNDKLGQEIAALNKDKAKLTQLIAQTASQIASLTSEYQNEESAIQAANAQYQCQLSGGRGCVAGNGPLAKTAAGNLQADEQKAAAIQSQISRLQNDPATHDRQQQLTSDQAQLKADQDEQTTLTNQASQATSRDTGILIRLQALGLVAARSTTAQAARWLVFALFVVFECMPVLSKILLNAAGAATYDQALAFDQGIQLQVGNRMSSDKLADADSTIAERDRIRTTLARRRPPRPRRSRRPGWSLARARRGVAPRGLQRPRPGQRPPRVPRDRRPRGSGWWPWPRRRAATWEPWASFPPGTADQTADGSQLPPVFLREPVPGAPGGQPGGTP